MENNPESFSNKPDLTKTADQLFSHGKELKDKTFQVARDVQEHASASGQYASAVAKEKVNDGLTALNDYIKSNPLTAIVAAVGFGYVLGWFRNK